MKAVFLCLSVIITSVFAEGWYGAKLYKKTDSDTDHPVYGAKLLSNKIPHKVTTARGAFYVFDLFEGKQKRVVRVFWQKSPGTYEVTIYEQGRKQAISVLKGDLMNGFLEKKISTNRHRFVFRVLGVKNGKISEVVVPAQQDVLAPLEATVEYSKIPADATGEKNSSANDMYQYKLSWKTPKDVQDVKSFTVFWIEGYYLSSAYSTVSMVNLPANQSSMKIQTDKSMGFITLAVSVNTKSSSSGVIPAKVVDLIGP